jgi:hypothetical protein
MVSRKKTYRRKSSKHQKLYKMRGCSKKSRKNHLGGTNLAYPSKNIQTASNPFLAYTGKGGSTCGISPTNVAPTNSNGSNPIYPSTGPTAGGFNFLNSQTQRGGNCGCGAQMGGSMGGSCGMGSCPFNAAQTGGAHRVGCRCSKCKMKGGSSVMSNNGIPYPNGLVGSPWTPNSSGWPGVDGIPGDSNHLGYNTYQPNDISRQMINTGAQPPFSIGGRKTRKGRKGQKGGVLSNFLGQDLINLGRQLQYGFGSAYNGLAGYQAPVNPMPWKGQLITPTRIV